MYTSHISWAQNTWSLQWYIYCIDERILIHHYHLRSIVYTRIHSWGYTFCVLRLTAQSCLTLCDPVDCSLPGSFVHGDSPGKNTRVGCHALLQGFLPTQGSNPGLSHCRQILYHVSHQGSPLDFLKKHLRFRNSPLLQQSFKVFRENRQFQQKEVSCVFFIQALHLSSCFSNFFKYDTLFLHHILYFVNLLLHIF